MRGRVSIITDWRWTDDGPDVAPGEEFERVITPQISVVLFRILVRGRGIHLSRLQIGAEEIPFRLEGSNGDLRGYSPRVDQAAREKLLRIQSMPQPSDDEITISAGLNVRITLHNEDIEPTRHRAALLVREDSPDA